MADCGAVALPVARVLVDTPLPHLDRPFDYLVPVELDAVCQPGVRVKVRFAGRDLSGFVLQRAATSDAGRSLAPVRTVVSAEQVLTPSVARVVRAVADRCGGTAADVARLAVPPRHATVEKAARPQPVACPEAPDPGGWGAYGGGLSFLEAVRDGQSPRAVWTPAPVDDWPMLLARLLLTAVSAGRGALAVLPDRSDVARLDAALGSLHDDPVHVVLTADLGPRARYRAFLAVARGDRRLVIGTRAAAFAPVADLGLMVLWDDGDDLLHEPQAPYPHTREVVLLRSSEEGCALVVGGMSCSPEAARLLQTGWARPLSPPRELVRACSALIRVVGDDVEQMRDPAARSARLPSLAWRTARDGLAVGPVLVQVPRSGYVPGLSCTGCGLAARCRECAGPLRLSESFAPPTCAWCRRVVAQFCCPACQGDLVRARVIGARRTADELGRAFPGVPVRTSGGNAVLSQVAAEPALVIATPGAEPVVDGGYAAALLLDGWALLGLPMARSGEEAARRWLSALALVRSRGDGGRVVLVGAESDAMAVQALVRVDPVGFARAELQDRAEADLFPAVRLAEITAAADDLPAVRAMLDDAAGGGLPPACKVLGPVPLGVFTPPLPGKPDPGTPPAQRLILRVPVADGPELARCLRAVLAARSTRRRGGGVRVRFDPPDFG